jgi:hypothetical protein
MEATAATAALPALEVCSSAAFSPACSKSGNPRPPPLSLSPRPSSSPAGSAVENSGRRLLEIMPAHASNR